jgi:peptidoglycan/LPS O-acetylase OafA/YrhL
VTARGVVSPVPAGRLHKLEALRGFAAIYVVIHHSLPAHYVAFGVDWGTLTRFGQEAVILFFLISGFVIHYSHQHASDRSFRGYFQKRFTRIYIPLLFVFPMTYGFVSLQEGMFVDPDWVTLLGNLAMLQNLANWGQEVLFKPYMLNKPLWSLTYEWWFYMLYFPLASRIASAELRTRTVLIGSVVAAVGYLLFPNMVFRTLMYFGMWWCGVALADLYLRGARIDFAAIRLPLATLLAIDAILAVNFWWRIDLLPAGSLSTYPFIELRHFAFATVALVAAVGWHRLGWIGFDTVFRPFLAFAPISYGIYISHYRIVHQRAYLSFIDNPYLEWAASIALLLVVASLVERVAYPRVRNWMLPQR